MDRQLQRQRVGSCRKVELIAAPGIQQDEIHRAHPRRVAILRDGPVVIGLAQQVIIVGRAAGDAGFAAVDVLRRSLHAVDADGVELPALNGTVEARPDLRRDVHFEKTFADGADPIVQAPFRLDQTGRPRLDACRRPGCHDPPSTIEVHHRFASLLGEWRRVNPYAGRAAAGGRNLRRRSFAAAPSAPPAR